MAVDKPPQRGLAFGVDPAVDAVGDEVIEWRQVETGRGGEIDGVKVHIRDRRLCREPPGVLDMHRHHVDAVKGSARMGGGEDRCGHALAAAEVAPGEAVRARGRIDPANERHMVEPGGSQHRLEIAEIRNVGNVTLEITRHRLSPGMGDPGGAESNSPIADKNVILPALSRSFPEGAPLRRAKW